MSAERAKSSSPDEGSDTESPTIEDQKAMEKAEEAKLKAKYPNFRPGVAGSTMLQKRLQRGPKYFDSGDYNMAKAKLNSKKPLAASEKQLLEESIGEAIPTPENLPRKPSLIQSKLASGALS